MRDLKWAGICGFAISMVLAFSWAATDTTTLQTIRGQVPTITAKMQSVGRVNGSTQIDVILALPLRNQDQMSAMLASSYNPQSPEYRHRLSAKQFADMFGPTQSDYDVVVKFAESKNLKVVATHANRTLLHLHGAASDVEKMFNVQLLLYKHPTEDREFYAPNVDPSVDLNVPILQVIGLDDLVLPRSPLDSPKQKTARGQSAQPDTGAFSAKDLRAAYAPGVTLDGSGQTVGIYNPDHGFLMSDITSYEDGAGIAHVPVNKSSVSGMEGDANNGFEVTLDIEMAMAMAPGLSQVIVYEDSGNYYDALNRMATDDTAIQLSSSVNPPPDGAAADQIYKQFQLQGQSFCCSSGDAGSYYPAVPPQTPGPIPFYADNPNITVVGGTMLTTTGPGGSWMSEVVWQDSFGSSGGGVSGSYLGNYSIPSWQQGMDMAANNGSTTMRNSPDVSMCGFNTMIFFKGGWTGAKGTSVAAPLFAGFLALANQQAAKFGQPTIGFVNPALYALGRSADAESYFHDITQGNNLTPWNRTPNNQNEYFAVKGYDLCTGWGTPTGLALIDALALRTPVLGAQLQYSGKGRCDPGPVAGFKAKYFVNVKGGWPPYTYNWNATGATIDSGGGASQQEAVVNVPDVGTTGKLTVTVSDAAGEQSTSTITVMGTDPDLANAELKFCELASQIDRFKHPIYINPGDPGPIDFEPTPYTEVELAAFRETLADMQAQVATMSRLSGNGGPGVQGGGH